MDILANVARRFDVAAVPGVRSVDQTILPRFVDLINTEGAKYDYVIGPRLGRTSSKKQYAFVYDTNRIELDQGSVYTVDDPQDLLHREPLVAHFRVRGPPPDRAFTFQLVNIHTDPNETDTELDALADVFLAVQRAAADDDVILLGDINVDEYHLGRLDQLPGIAHAISGTTTNTHRDKMRASKMLRRVGRFPRRTVTQGSIWGVSNGRSGTPFAGSGHAHLTHFGTDRSGSGCQHFDRALGVGHGGHSGAGGKGHPLGWGIG
jgi:deoxyribonuclease-1-like protein